MAKIVRIISAKIVDISSAKLVAVRTAKFVEANSVTIAGIKFLSWPVFIEPLTTAVHKSLPDAS